MSEPLMAWGLGLISTVSIGIFAWAFAINTKVNVNEATQKIRQEDLKELLNEKFDGVGNKLTNLSERLARIERAMNGALKGH